MSTISIFNPFAKFQRRSTFLGSQNYMPTFSMANGKIVPNDFVDVERALNNPDVFAMVNLISSDVASCGFRNTGQYESLLSQPSTLINGYSFWQSAVIQLLLTGNTYLLMHTNNNFVESLEQIPTGQVNVLLADDSAFMQYEINFVDERGHVVVPQEQMIHIRLMPTGEVTNGYQYIGVSPLQSLSKSLAAAESANQLTLGTLAHALAPTNLITVPDAKLNSEEKDVIRNKFEEQNTGGNSGRPIVLDQSASLTQLQINADVAKFLNTLDWGSDRIAEAFGVPSSYLNQQSDQQSSITDISKLYVSNLNRYLKPVVSELAMKLQLPDLQMDILDATDTDGQQTLNLVTKLTTGKTPVLSAEQAQRILVRKGLIDQDDIGQAAD